MYSVLCTVQYRTGTLVRYMDQDKRWRDYYCRKTSIATTYSFRFSASSCTAAAANPSVKNTGQKLKPHRAVESLHFTTSNQRKVDSVRFIC